MLKQQHYTLTNVKKVKSQLTTPLIIAVMVEMGIFNAFNAIFYLVKLNDLLLHIRACILKASKNPLRELII